MLGFVGRVARTGRRWSSTLDETAYIEQLQLKDIKSKVFYDEQAERRNYFYYVDLQGQLFLEDMVPKNIATSLKSPKFLKFFFHMLRPHAATDLQYVTAFLEYPYRSPCGPEMNYIKAADTPIVVTELQKHEAQWLLRTNADPEADVPFAPSSLAISASTGRLYHWTESKYVQGYSLVRSQVAVDIANFISFPESPDAPHVFVAPSGDTTPIKVVQ
ncbi:hypothetical protein SDRG_09322 [Saprolegnia diclina VS20]|uniref:Uncharacterized protein n=1 Tax=Saprolegnia diclina (strain VS20) TaxID=1156394 RepID=T0QF36_SAPDV|nr:hypothetical protein SDRG_09322 [Saprolegnia diclina VS20]EQC33346.1 hypothetical protein SDRG_09322 [Saprolegnia diclina VS20]|eukprot:XP_008613469.1 hypothetical protein SDRG_09322 [Saprolegnia diclina VS20]